MRSHDAPTWDVMILNFDGHAPLPVAAFREGHGPWPMGPVASVRADIDMTLADIDWSDPRRGLLDADEPCFSIDLGQVDPVDGFLVRVSRPRGAAPLIAHMCLVNGWAALDCARGVYLDLEDPDRWPSGPPLAEA
jgi:hypothetical protein